MFELLSGRHPVLVGRENANQYKKRMKHYEGVKPYKADMSNTAVDLFTKMTEKVPSQRINVDQALEHPWFASLSPGKRKSST